MGLYYHRLLKPLLAAVLAASCCAAAQDAALFGQIDGIVNDLAALTGLKPKNRVPSDMIDRAHLKVFLETRIQEQVKPEEIRAEETTLKMFGFLPPGYDLRASTVELLTEQAAAFYDFKKKKLFVLDATPGAMQQTALIHELAHALADQHFNLGKFMEHSGKSDDASTARLAVMEGQASWLMAESMARTMGQPLKENRALLEMMTSGDLAGGQFPVFDKAPLYLRETLLFPYTKGLLFQHAVYEKLDRAAFAEVFRNPPETSQQILHPELYFTHKHPTTPPLPDPPPAARRWRELSAGTVGELDHAILLRQYLGKDPAATLSPQWTGGRYRITEQSKAGPSLLQYGSEWNSAEAARQFFDAYKTVLRTRWKNLTVSVDEPGRFAGLGDGEPFTVTLEGARVSSLQGPTPQK